MGPRAGRIVMAVCVRSLVAHRSEKSRRLDPLSLDLVILTTFCSSDSLFEIHQATCSKTERYKGYQEKLLCQKLCSFRVEVVALSAVDGFPENAWRSSLSSSTIWLSLCRANIWPVRSQHLPSSCHQGTLTAFKIPSHRHELEDDRQG